MVEEEKPIASAALLCRKMMGFAHPTRCPVDGIRIAGRATQGVIVFSNAEGERVRRSSGSPRKATAATHDRIPVHFDRF